MKDNQVVLIQTRLKRLNEYIDQLEDFLLTVEEPPNFSSRSVKDLQEEHERLAKMQVALLEAMRRCGYSLEDEIKPEVLQLARNLSNLEPEELQVLQKSLIRVVGGKKAEAK